MKTYRKIFDTAPKANADNFFQAGWVLIETRTDEDDTAFVYYRVGWRRDAGEPVIPPDIDDSPSAYLQNVDVGPAEN
jgi:hypothetical protein